MVLKGAENEHRRS